MSIAKEIAPHLPYLRRYARQNHESGGAKTFVAVSAATPDTILGYYTISPGAMAFAKAPATVTKGGQASVAAPSESGRATPSLSVHLNRDR